MRSSKIGQTLGKKLKSTKVVQETVKLIEEGANVDFVDKVGDLN